MELTMEYIAVNKQHFASLFVAATFLHLHHFFLPEYSLLNKKFLQLQFKIECCTGTWDGTNSGLFTAVEEECIWQMGDHGQRVDCGHDEMAFGRCGSGWFADCHQTIEEYDDVKHVEKLKQDVTHGLKCCPAQLYI